MYNEPMSIPKLLENSKLHSISDEHLITGLLFREFEIEVPRGEQVWKQQWFHNTVLQDELKSMAPLLGDQVIILKGMALIESIYEDSGKRFMSDIDLLVPTEKLAQIENILKEAGYQSITGERWKANNFKSEWTRTVNGVEVNIELHTRLFYHSADLQWRTQPSHIEPLRILDVDHQITHLIGHCAFQHNFLKLYWLIDIFLYLKSHNVNWEAVHQHSKDLKIENSFIATVWVLNHYFDCEIKIPKKPSLLMRKLLSMDLLLNPNQIGKDYFLLKHILKDSILESLQYDLGWSLVKLKSLFSKEQSSEKNI
jgi:hypothetical protein